jgi:superfamily II DNA or RNA helicase
VIRAALDQNERVLVIAPAALRAHWRKHLARLGERIVAFTTHTALSNGRMPAVQPALIVIDEAHAFRNPRTRRYRTLQRLRKDARLLLLTATPINNSAEDLYHVIRTFAGDDAFRDLGVADLSRAFRTQAQAQVDRVLQEVLVRRTRAQVRAGKDLAFPERAAPIALRYDAEWSVAIYEALEALTFAPYALESAAPAELLRMHLLKRLESSTTAFRSSIRALRAATELFLTGSGARPPKRGDDWVQLSLPIAIGRLENPQRVAELRLAALADAKLLISCQAALRESADAKLARLISLLETECAGARVLVFSQYADTAMYLWKQLRNRFRVGLITGSDARLGANRAARSTVIECFAPRANGRLTQLHARLQLDVLIATDVLSEGLNLQGANVVVNYEISWNPVTLMQRIGRIDRLGSPHARVRVYNFIPERGLDRMLRLMERVETKLATIERLVGSDSPVLDAPKVGEARRAIELSIQPPDALQPTTLSTLSDLESLRAELAGAPANNSDCDRPLAATICGEQDVTLVALQSRGVIRLLLCDCAGVRESAPETSALLRNALQLEISGSEQPFDVTPAIDWLLAEQRSEQLRAPTGGAAQHAAAQKLLRLAGALPVGSAHARVADGLLRRLAQPVSRDVEMRLSGWVNSTDRAAGAALDDLRVALAPPASNRRQTSVKPSVVALLAVRKTRENFG